MPIQLPREHDEIKQRVVYTLDDMQFESGTTVFVRVDYNVPVHDSEVVDDTRIRASIETLGYLLKKGAIIIACSHIESAEGSLRPAFTVLKKLLPNNNVLFCDDILPTACDMAKNAQSGTVILCENIRHFDGEKKNDEIFAKQLRDTATLYVNDAFSVSHRQHASVHALPKAFRSRTVSGLGSRSVKVFIGRQMEKEIVALSKVFIPKHPFLFILGGAKFDTKLPLLKKFVSKAEYVVVGGALAHSFYKADGYSLGTSLVDQGDYDIAELRKQKKEILYVPQDVVIQQQIGQTRVGTPEHIAQDEKIVDAGPESVQYIKELISKASFIVWNGPLGAYEQGYSEATKQIAAAFSKNKAYTIVGGGDTIAALATEHALDNISFVSTGGGAMLEYLAQGSLPGIDVLSYVV